MEGGTEVETTPGDLCSPLLLHSLSEFRELIVSCLGVSGARSVVEIGSEEGSFTRELLAWAEKHDGHVYCIDPAPAPALVDVAEGSFRVDLLVERSLVALEHLEACDAYFVDGDHNYFTVSGELLAIDERTMAVGGQPLIFLHDVSWPAGHRDMYYAPDTVPSEARHDHTYDKGAVPWQSDLVTGGFRGEGQFAWALHEHGPGNGVRAAVEDFLRDRPHLALVTVPCIFGLGVVYPRSAPYASDLSDLLGRYDDDVLLRRLEDNRVRLYLRVLQAQDEITELHRHFEGVQAEFHRELEKASLTIRDVQVENRALWSRVAELEGQLASSKRRQDELLDEVGKVVRSRSVVLAERLSRLHGRLRGRSSLSCERLRALVEQTPE